MWWLEESGQLSGGDSEAGDDTRELCNFGLWKQYDGKEDGSRLVAISLYEIISGEKLSSY